ncbi:tryptophan 7-halogenase [Sphingomonas sp. KR1UV-12]|uniref:Tryptophan 7-halogenase n=1 Tax=Sphingomonas aurea TaxID=3063994 RepID=A0ABT9ELA6_9SPHN|nr:tryptophan halogenase family protein [Sphingomonas sp. KR1UV-12]MDP1027571.1 tryptophan 7-halogenase [Sphingomonas sp. KR1UV-12]
MSMRAGPLARICIVGGGTAGWIAAALIAHHYPQIAVELVESDDIGTIGVGESTIPPFLQLLARLGVSESDFIRDCQASYKLGIEFRDWQRPGTAYFHPFGDLGTPDTTDFYQLWLRARAEGLDLPLQDFAPANVMAQAGRFTLPFAARQTPVGTAAYALHVDAKRVAAFLRRYAEARGVVRTEGLVDDVAVDPGGFVQAIRLRTGEQITADLFLDCTGFRALLAGKALGGGYRDWSHWLLCDRAVAVQTANAGPPPPFTLAQAQPAGWRWRIPLQHRTGNGHVFSSAHMSDDEATALLLAQVEGEPVTAPVTVPFRTGVREAPWQGNVVAIGLAQGFIEPLESTAIHLVYRAVDYLFRFLPARDCAAELAGEFNRRMIADYEEIRDFVVLHYCLTERRDTPFWTACATMELPDSLARRIALFRVNGTVPDGTDELFRAVSWQAVISGMGVTPRGWHPAMDRAAAPTLAPDLTRAAATLARFVDTLPTHARFIADHVRAPAP